MKNSVDISLPERDDDRIIQEQKLLAEIAKKLADPTNFSRVIDGILSEIGEKVAVDRVYIFSDSSDRKTTSNTYEWCAKGVEPQIDKLQLVPYENLESWIKILDSKHIILAEDIKDLPDELYKKLAPQKIKSILALPIRSQKQSFGFIGFDNTARHRKWGQDEIYLLETVAGMLANVFLRQNSDEKLNILSIEEDRERSEVDQTRQNYESFFNAIDDFLFVLDGMGNIIHVNKTVTARLGYSENELIGKSVLFVHPPERRAEAQKIVADMLAGRASVCPVPLITKSGQQIPVETRISPGTWGGKTALFGVTKDVSDIALSQEKFSKVFELNPSICGLSGIEDRKYVEINQAFCDILGFPKSEVIGKTAIELGILDEKTIAEIMKHADKNGKISNVDAKLRTKDGNELDVIMSAENIFVQDIKYRFTVVQDVTALKKSERLLRQEESVLNEALSISNELIEKNLDTIDYGGVTNRIREISGAKYVSFNLFAEDGKRFTTVAFSGLSKNTEKASSVLGFKLAGKQWGYDPVRERKIKDKVITKFNSLHELIGSVLPGRVASLVEKVFGIGMVYVVKITKGKKTIGDFTLLFPTNNLLQNQDIVELFSNQIGLLMDRHVSDEKLALSESRYKSYVVNAPIAVFVCDEKGRFSDVNPAAERITGYSHAELITKSVPDILPVESHALAIDLLNSLGIKGYAAAEFAFKRKDGTIGLWAFSGVKISPTEFMGLCTDVTVRKKAEDDLRASEERLRILIDQSPIAIEFYDAKGSLVSANPASLGLFGIKDKHEIEHFSLFDDPNISDEHKKDLKQAKSIRYEAIFDFDKVKENKLYSTSKSGQIWLDVLITPTQSGDTASGGYLLEIQDISSQKSTSIKINDNVGELEKLNSIMVGRELKMVELKKEIENLKAHAVDNVATGDGIYIDGITLEEDIIKSLSSDYKVMIKKSRLSRSNKSKIIKKLRILETDSIGHDKKLKELSRGKR